MMCLMALSWGLVIVGSVVEGDVYVKSPAMRMSIPSGLVAAMLLVVMSVGSSGSRLSHCVIDVRGSCVGYCFWSCASRCFVDVCVSGFVSAHVYFFMWCHVLRRASSPAAVPPYISRRVRERFGIFNTSRCVGVSLEGVCGVRRILLVMYVRLGSFGVFSLDGGC